MHSFIYWYMPSLAVFQQNSYQSIPVEVRWWDFSYGSLFAWLFRILMILLKLYVWILNQNCTSNNGTKSNFWAADDFLFL